MLLFESEDSFIEIVCTTPCCLVLEKLGLNNYDTIFVTMDFSSELYVVSSEFFRNLCSLQRVNGTFADFLTYLFAKKWGLFLHKQFEADCSAFTLLFNKMQIFFPFVKM